MPTIRTISIRRAAVAALAGVMILSLLPATTMAGSTGTPKAVRQAEWRVLGEINRYRAIRGLAPYRMAHQARQAARQRSTEMRNLNYLSHHSPTGKHATTLLNQRGVRYQAGAENIGRIGFVSWQSAIDGMMGAWQGSSGHNASILSSGYNYIGIGVAKNDNVAYFTTIFLLQRDHTAPRSGMAASSSGISVAATPAGTRYVTVKWWGKDPVLQRNHAGIKHYTVQHKRVGGVKGWQTVKSRTLQTSLSMTLTKGHHKFRVRAVDRAGNVGKWKRPVLVRVG
ncbi:MAG: CAP domain-containing protein [Candidatus Limnocylindrales bacterium]